MTDCEPWEGMRDMEGEAGMSTPDESPKPGWYWATYRKHPENGFCVERCDNFWRIYDAYPREFPPDLILGPRLKDVLRDVVRLDWAITHLNTLAVIVLEIKRNPVAVRREIDAEIAREQPPDRPNDNPHEALASGKSS